MTRVGAFRAVANHEPPLWKVWRGNQRAVPLPRPRPRPQPFPLPPRPVTSGFGVPLRPSTNPLVLPRGRRGRRLAWQSVTKPGLPWIPRSSSLKVTIGAVQFEQGVAPKRSKGLAGLVPVVIFVFEGPHAATAAATSAAWVMAVITRSTSQHTPVPLESPLKTEPGMALTKRESNCPSQSDHGPNGVATSVSNKTRPPQSLL